MREQTCCDFCGEKLELSREFIYQMESLDFMDDDGRLEAIRRSPDYHGEPLRLCKACHQGVEENRLDKRSEEEALERKHRRAMAIMKVGVLVFAGLLAALLFLEWFMKR